MARGGMTSLTYAKSASLSPCLSQAFPGVLIIILQLDLEESTARAIQPPCSISFDDPALLWLSTEFLTNRPRPSHSCDHLQTGIPWDPCISEMQRQGPSPSSLLPCGSSAAICGGLIERTTVSNFILSQCFEIM